MFDDQLAPARASVRDALSILLVNGSPEELARVFRARGALLERARDATRGLIEGSAPTLPVWARYSGVVWTHLDPLTLRAAQRRRLLVPSGLYGVSAGDDHIADFRLAMKVSLAGIGPLSSFWRPNLGRALEDMNGATFVNLLTQEHDAALAANSALAARMVKVRFLRHGGERVVGHDAKAAKGVVARRVLERGVDALEDFRWRGWRGQRVDGHFEVRSER